MEPDQAFLERLTALPQCFGSEASLLSKPKSQYANSSQRAKHHDSDTHAKWRTTGSTSEQAGIWSFLDDARSKLRNVLANLCFRDTNGEASDHQYVPPSCQQMIQTRRSKELTSIPKTRLSIYTNGNETNETRNWSWTGSETSVIGPRSSNRWSWTNSQAPNTPRMRLCAMQTLLHGDEMGSMHTAWACLQVNQFDEILARPVRLPPSSRRPMLKNQAFKPNLLPREAVAAIRDRSTSRGVSSDEVGSTFDSFPPQDVVLICAEP